LKNIYETKMGEIKKEDETWLDFVVLFVPFK